MNGKLSENKIKNTLNKLTEEIKEHPERYINYYHEAKKLFEIKNFSAAHRILDQALALNRSAVELYSLKGKIFKCEKNYEKSIEYFNKALDIEESAEDYFSLADICYIQCNYSDALTNIEMALKFQTDSFEYWFYSGIILEKLEKFELAFDAFINALKFCTDIYKWDKNFRYQVEKVIEKFLEELISEKDNYVKECNDEKIHSTLLKILDVFYKVNRYSKYLSTDRVEIGYSAAEAVEEMPNVLFRLERYEDIVDLCKECNLLLSNLKLIKINSKIYSIVQKIPDDISIERKLIILFGAKDIDTLHNYYYYYRLGLIFESKGMYEKSILNYIEVLQSGLRRLNNRFFKDYHCFNENLQYIQFSLKRIISILDFGNDIECISDYLKEILYLCNAIIKKTLQNGKIEYTIKYNKCIEFCDLAINIIEKALNSNSKVLEKIYIDLKNGDLDVLDNYIANVWLEKKYQVMENYANAIVKCIQEGYYYNKSDLELEDEINIAISIFDLLIKMNPNKAYYYYKKAEFIEFKLFFQNKYEFEDGVPSEEFFKQSKESYLIILKLYDTSVKLDPKSKKYADELTNLVNRIKAIPHIDVNSFLEMYNGNKMEKKFYIYVNFEDYSSYVVDYNNDIDGPEWLAGTETEEQYWEHSQG